MKNQTGQISNGNGDINNIITVNTWLPVFPGFYGSVFESDNAEEREIDYINEQREEAGKLDKITLDDCRFDYKDYKFRVAKECCGIIEGILNTKHFLGEKGITIEYQYVDSPREYNFANDSINCKMTVDWTKIRDWFLDREHKMERMEILRKYLADHYTPCSGFIPHYDNILESEDWLGSDLNEWAGMLSREHQMAAVLQCMLESDDPDIEATLYDDCEATGIIDVLNRDELIAKPDKGSIEDLRENNPHVLFSDESHEHLEWLNPVLELCEKPIGQGFYYVRNVWTGYTSFEYPTRQEAIAEFKAGRLAI